MKLDELKKIIKEELKSILEANAPEKEEKKTKEEEKITTKPTPRRKIGREDIPKQSPIPIKNKTPLKEIEKNILDKITARFKNSQKVNEMLSLIDDKDLKNYTPSPEITDGEIKTMSLEQVKSAYNELKNEWDTPSKRIMVKKLRDRIEVLKPDYFQKSKK